jgi:hypothetical protein
MATSTSRTGEPPVSTRALAGEGNDYIDVADGAADDYVDCGEHSRDFDTVCYDGPIFGPGGQQISLGDRVLKCEDPHPI